MLHATDASLVLSSRSAAVRSPKNSVSVLWGRAIHTAKEKWTTHFKRGGEGRGAGRGVGRERERREKREGGREGEGRGEKNG